MTEKVFAGYAGIEVSPTAEDVEGFNAYIGNYKANLPVEEWLRPRRTKRMNNV